MPCPDTSTSFPLSSAALSLGNDGIPASSGWLPSFAKTAKDNTDAIKAATDELNKVWGEVAQNLYSQPGADGQPGAGPQPGQDPNAGAQSEAPKDDKEVQDASYEVVDEEDKK